MSRLLVGPARRKRVTPRIVARTGVIAGRDCGVAHLPQDSVIDEVIWLGAAGLDNARALAGATAAAADAPGLGGVTGHLVPGLRADVRIVDGDPPRELAALRRPLAVFKAGSRVR
jgi:imidazolonepropionase-like amidohydrolase